MKKTNAFLIISMMLCSMIFSVSMPTSSTSEFQREVNNFDKIWYHSTEGFNKNNQGTLILAVTYTNNSLRNIDYASFTYTDEPFYLRIAFGDELTIERDVEGNIIYEEPKNGYIYLNKAVVDNHFPSNIKRLASKGFTYKTITYDGDQWYRISVPNFDREYEWKEFDEPMINEKWYTWGNKDSIKFETRSMYIEQTISSMGHLEFDITHDSDNSGQIVAISKSYLASNGITNPYFEWGEVKTWKPIGYTENATHYFIDPEHFSEVGIHETSSGYFNSIIYLGDPDELTHLSESLLSNRTVGSTSERNILTDTVTDDYFFGANQVPETLTFRPEANGDVIQLIPKSGSNWENVDEEGHDGYTTYVAVTGTCLDECICTDELRDLYILENHTTETGDILNVTVFVMAGRNANPCPVWIKTVIKINGTEYRGNQEALPENWHFYLRSTKYTTNPNTGNPWTWNEIDDLQAGIEMLDSEYLQMCTQVYVEVVYNKSVDITHIALEIPVSTSVSGIVEVWNRSSDQKATEVLSLASLEAGDFYYDSACQYVYIGLENTSVGQEVNWSVNCTYGGTFSVSFPLYREVGDYIFLQGVLKDVNGNTLDRILARTYVYYQNLSIATPYVEWNCTGGNYQAIISTSTLVPGTYSISVEFTDVDSGIIFKEGSPLYLSVAPGTGVHVASKLYFNFYNNNTGLGLSPELFKIYASEDTSVGFADRIHAGVYYTAYTGQTVYYRVDDYFDNQVYPLTGSYESLEITDIEQFEDVPIDWYSFSVKNMNHSIVYFKMTNASRTYSQYLYPYEPFYWDVLEGIYTINLTYYNAETDVIEDYFQEDITITDDTYYWIRGYDLQDIIIEITNTNSTIMDQIINIGVNISNEGATIINQALNIASYFSNIESNITTQLNLVWSGVNNTQTVIVNQVNSVWQDITNWVAYTDGYNTLPGTVSHWTFDEGSGTYANDSVGDNDGTLTNCNWTSGKFGNAIDFNGTGDYIDVGDNISLNITNAITLSAWVKYDGSTGKVQGIISKSSFAYAYSLYVSSDILYVLIRNIHGANVDAYTSILPYKNVWTHIVGVYDRTNVSLYVNGILKDSNPQVDDIESRPTANVYIGRDWEPTRIFNGTIDDVRIFNRALTTDEVTQLYQSSTDTSGTAYIGTQVNIVAQDVNNANTTIHTQINSVTQAVSNMESNVTTQIVTVSQQVNNFESNITTQINAVSISITNTETNITSQINLVSNQIINQDTNLTTQFNIIDINITNMNTSMTDQINSVSVQITNHDTDIDTQLNAILASIVNNNTNIIDQVNLIWNEINNTNSTIGIQVTGVNTKISTFWSDVNYSFSVIQSNISYIDTNITNLITDVNATLVAHLVNVLDNVSEAGVSVFDRVIGVLTNLSNINTSLHDEILARALDIIGNITSEHYDTILSIVENITAINTSLFLELQSKAIVIFNFYNTNQGLGLDRETLRIYVNDERLIDNLYYCNNNSVINLTIKDYYNFTLYSNDFTISAPFTFIDLGLTFHSWLFGNKNDDYYMISLLKYGGSRWWERGIVPYGEREFMIPSGNYEMRIYDKDNNEIYNSSGNISVVNSRVYVIHGTNLTEIISGQSVIRGQLLELSSDLDYALMPDITIVSRNPPTIFSIYDKEGMAFGNEFYMICPPLITIATTRVTQYGHPINSIPMIPGNGSVANGTVTIIRDTLYLSGPGSITWVNITYTDNGTVLGNTSYIPTRISIYGQNLTINASGDILVTREVKFNQVKKFDWVYYPFEGYGPESDRAGWHSAGIEIVNPLAVPLYEVYAIAGFSDESNPDSNSVEVRDTTNGGIIVERGPDYDVTGAAIHFNLLSIDAYETRAFTIGYYKTSAESYIYDEGTVSISGYVQTMFDGNPYNTFPAQWINPYANTFRGALYIKLNFDVPIGIDTTTMRIRDLTNNMELDPSFFIPGDKYIRISAEGMGDVLPGSGRSFDVYFLMEEFPGADPKEFHLNTQIFWGITPFLIAFLTGIAFLFLGIYLAISDKKEQRDRWKVCVGLGLFIVVIFIFMAAMGL